MISFQESIIVWIQSILHPQFDVFFGFVSFLGSFKGVLLFWSFFVWCVSYRFGVRLILITAVAHYLGSIWLKALIALPRPYVASTAVIPIVTEEGFSFPSGHALNAALTWGALAWFSKRTIVVAMSLSLFFLVGFSRIYLGVHYPLDVLAGWFIGFVFLWVYSRYGHLIELAGERVKLVGRVAINLLAGVGLYFLMIHFGPEGIPRRWVALPFIIYYSVWVGSIINERWIHYHEEGSGFKKTLRFVLGSFVLYAAVLSFPKFSGTYLFAGFWITVGAPSLFRLLKLAR